MLMVNPLTRYLLSPLTTHGVGAVDMDVYGAFQFCSIGILTAPVTVRLSRTYFNDPGRNVIFLWTSLVLAGRYPPTSISHDRASNDDVLFQGLLSLTVEFYRSNTSDCTHNDNGQPISPDPSRFPYGDNPSCGLTCTIDKGPFSPMRGGATNNIYVIPAPDKFTFGAATLLAAACCIPAILSLISMWNKIVENNWKLRFGGRVRAGIDEDEAIEGTNGATIRKMRQVNITIKEFLEVIGIPLFGGAVLAILVVGERNLFSTQVKYQTEPIASIGRCIAFMPAFLIANMYHTGQWAPIAGTGFAALGSLYLLLTDPEAMKRKNGTKSDESVHHCDCPHHHDAEHQDDYQSNEGAARANNGDTLDGEPANDMNTPEMQEISRAATASHSHSQITATLSATERHPTSLNISQSARTQTLSGQQQPDDVGNRKKVASRLTKINHFFTNAGDDRANDAEFKQGKALDFPEIPGEQQRNPELIRIREQYNQPRDEDGNVTTGLRRQRSRAASFSSNISVRNGANSAAPSRRTSLESQRHSTDEPRTPAAASTEGTTAAPPPRRSTLEVPPQTPARAYQRTPRSQTLPQIDTTVAGSYNTPPSIVVSPGETETPMSSTPDQSHHPRHAFRASSEPMLSRPPAAARGPS